MPDERSGSGRVAGRLRASRSGGCLVGASLFAAAVASGDQAKVQSFHIDMKTGESAAVTGILLDERGRPMVVTTAEGQVLSPGARGELEVKVDLPFPLAAPSRRGATVVLGMGPRPVSLSAEMGLVLPEGMTSPIASFEERGGTLAALTSGQRVHVFSRDLQHRSSFRSPHVPRIERVTVSSKGDRVGLIGLSEDGRELRMESTDPPKEKLMTRILAELPRIPPGTDVQLDSWLRDSTGTGHDLRRGFRRLAEDVATRSLASGEPQALALLREVSSLVESISQQPNVSPPAGLDAALDALVYSSPLIHDVAVACAGDARERERREGLWTRALLVLRDVRIVTAGRGHASRIETREQLREVTRAIDGSPRPRGAADPDFVAAVRQATAALLPAAVRNEEAVLERPFAAAIAASLDPLVAVGYIPRSDVAALVLRWPRISFLRALAGVTGDVDLAAFLRALVAVRENIDAAKGKESAARDASALIAALAQLRDATGLLCPPGQHPLSAGFIDLHSIAVSMTPRLASGTEHSIEQVWKRAVAALVVAQTQASIRLGVQPAHFPRDAPEQARRHFEPLAILRLCASDAPYRAAVGGKLDALLPPAMGGLSELLLRAMVAGRRPSRSGEEQVFPPGATLGDYVVVRQLGSGAMGHCLCVRKRVDLRDGRGKDYVLKLPKPGANLPLFIREATALVRLSELHHDAIIVFVGFVARGYRLPFLVMEMAPGISLSAHLERIQPAGAHTAALPTGMAPREVLERGSILAEGLGHAHAAGIGHYDLKPDNIIRSDSGNLVMVDWGLSGMKELLGGTPRYMSPERWQNVVPVGPSADVYALGCIFYEMATGEQLLSSDLRFDPPARRAPYEAVARVLVHSPNDAVEAAFCAALSADLPLLTDRVRRRLGNTPLAEAILRCISPSPSARPTAPGLATTLRAALSQTQGSSPP